MPAPYRVTLSKSAAGSLSLGVVLAINPWNTQANRSSSFLRAAESWQPPQEPPVHRRNSRANDYCVVFVGGGTPMPGDSAVIAA